MMISSLVARTMIVRRVAASSPSSSSPSLIASLRCRYASSPSSSSSLNESHLMNHRRYCHSSSAIVHDASSRSSQALSSSSSLHRSHHRSSTSVNRRYLHHRCVNHASSSSAAASSINTTSSSSSFDSSTLPPIPLFHRLSSPSHLHLPSSNFVSSSDAHTYASLLSSARDVCALLLLTTGKRDLRDVRVAMLYNSSPSFASVIIGVWMAGGVAVPLHPSHAAPEIEYILNDAGASILLHSAELKGTAEKLKLPMIKVKENEGEAHTKLVQYDAPSPTSSSSSSTSSSSSLSTYGSSDDFLARRALFIYTSGTTGKPKGVVWTHSMLDAQMTMMSSSWRWSSSDHILLVLPLHHVHGLINVLLTSMYNGARCSILAGKAGAAEIDAAMSSLELDRTPLTVFMAVPTIYSRLMSHYASLSPVEQSAFTRRLLRLRLAVCGSASLPRPLADAWTAASEGGVLLERYGMTETGMILSQSIDAQIRRYGESGTVGTPMQSVQIKIVPMSESAKEAAATNDSSSSSSAEWSPMGELLVRGPSVFSEYWKQPEKTKAEFDADGYFRTGDIVSQRTADSSSSSSSSSSIGSIRIVGRSSVDVIKSGGYKISALDVERELLSHPQVDECAVMGLADDVYGQTIVAIIVWKRDISVEHDDEDDDNAMVELIKWCQPRIASHQIPRRWLKLDTMPRNAMGKTNKKELIKLFKVENKK